MISNVVSALIGIALFVTYLGFIVAWVKPIALAVISLGVVAMMVYDLILSLGSGDGAPR